MLNRRQLQRCGCRTYYRIDMDGKRGIPPERMGFRDILAFVLAAFWTVLPITVIAIGIFVVLLLIFRLL
jgi:hypothetical protein